MSSSLEISTQDESFPKVVLHERNKPTMGTKYVGTKTSITVKRNIALREKSAETETKVLDSKIRKYDRTPVRSKRQLLSSENINRKKKIPEKKILTKSTNSEKKIVQKSDFSKRSEVNDKNVTNLNYTNDSVSEQKSNARDIIFGNISSNCYVGIPDLSSEANKILETHISDSQSSVSSTHETFDKMMLSKHSDIDNSLPEHNLEVTQTSDVVSLQTNVSTHLKHISPKFSSNESLSTAKSTSIPVCKTKVTSSCSDTRKHTSLKKSIPKPQSVILNSCDAQQKNFKLSDVNKDTFCISNTSDFIHKDCNKESDLDQIENTVTSNYIQTESLTSHSIGCIEQTVELSKNAQSSTQNTKPDKHPQKSSLQGSVPSYLRMTSSAANKGIKKKPESSQRSVIQDKSVKSANTQSRKFFNENKLTCDITKKNLQSGLRNGIKSNDKKRNKVRNISCIEDRKSNSSSPDDYKSDMNSSTTSSETETINCLKENSKTSQPPQVLTKQKIGVKDTRSSFPQKLKLPVKSKTTIRNVSKESFAKKQTTYPMNLNMRPRSLTPTVAQSVPITHVRHTSRDTSMSSRSRSTTPGASSLSSDNSCSDHAILSNKSLKKINAQTVNNKNSNKVGMEREKIQNKKAAMKSLNTAPRSSTPTDPKSISYIKRTNFKDTNLRSRSTTPAASTISPGSNNLNSEKMSKKTLDLQRQSDKQLKVFKSKQDPSSIKISKRGLQTPGNDQSTNRVLSSRQHLNTPPSSFASSKTISIIKPNKTRTDDQIILNKNKTEQSLKRDSKSRSRSNTPDVSSTRSGNSKVRCSPSEAHTLKEMSPIECQPETNELNIQSHTTSISSPTESKSKRTALSSDKIKNEKTFKDKDLKAKSIPNTPETPSLSPNFKSQSNQTAKVVKRITQTGRTAKTGFDSSVKSNITEATNVSRELKEIKQGRQLKALSTNVKQRNPTPTCNLKSKSNSPNTSSNSSQRSTVLRNQASKISSKTDRKSRSRSSTPGAPPSPKYSNTNGETSHEHKFEHKRETKCGLISKIPVDISSKSRKCNDLVSQNSIAQKEKDITHASDFPMQSNKQCKGSTKETSNEQTHTNVIKILTPLQSFESENDKVENIINHDTLKESAVDNQQENISTSIGSNNITETRHITALDSEHRGNESYYSSPILSGNSASESETILEIKDSKSSRSNKIEMLSSQEGDKPIMELTELSVKPDSWLKAGKIQNSVKNKKSHLQASLEKRSRQESGGTNTRNKPIKTLTSDNKLRQAQRMSAIKTDDISTRSRSKSTEMETRKQNSQLPGKLPLSNVKSKSETQCVYVTGELIGKEPCQTLEVKDVLSLNIPDNQDIIIKETTKLDLTESIQHDTKYIKNENSKCLDLNKIDKYDKYEHGNLLSEQSSIYCETDHCSFSSGSKYTENPENIKCTDNNSRKHQYASCAKCRDNDFSDREVNARDPKSKVINNCLSEVRENEIQLVNCEKHTGMNTVRNKNEMYGCEVFSYHKRNHFATCQNEKDLKLSESDCKMESMTLELCNICKMQKNSSLSNVLEVEDDFQLESCREFTVNDNKNECVKNNIATNCMTNDKTDAKLIYSTCSCDGNCNNSECHDATNFEYNSANVERQHSLDSVYQLDKKSENSTFKIDTYDVNSSNEVPITEGYAFKHTDLSDLKGDKAKCTDALPVTGAVSFQSTYKRQDKKIASLSNCGKRNTALCSNENCLLRDSDKFVVPHFDSSYKCAIMEQDITSMEEEDVDTSVVVSSSENDITSNITEMNVLLASQICVDSIKAEQNLSDWHSTDILDIIHQENDSQLQVINNCEINKETSGPNNTDRTLERRENVSCDNITDGVNILAQNCEKLNMEINEDNDTFNVQCDNTKQSSSNESMQDVGENLIHKHVNDNDNEKSCIQSKNILESDDNLVKGSRQEQTLTCCSQIVKNMNFPGVENDSPERDDRTMDVQLINTDHDLSLNSHCISANVSTKSNEECHTCSLHDIHCTICDREQLTSSSDTNTENCSNDTEVAFNGNLPITNFLQNQLQRLKPDGYMSDAELKKDMTCKPYVFEAQEKQTDCIHYGNDAQCLFVQKSSIEDGLIMFHCENSTKQKEKDTPVGRQTTYWHGKGYLQNDSDKNEKNKYSIDKSSEKQGKGDPKLNNSSFCNIPKLSELICELYPNLKEKTKLCSESSNKKEINQEDRRCIDMTQNANLNTCFSNMKLNDSACLFQSYTQLDRDDIKVSSQCLHCADLSQTPENISNSYSKKLHLQDDLTEANSAEHGSLIITGNKLCTGTIPCDGSKGKISTHISLSKSTENTDLNDLSLPFDVSEDINSGWTMSRDSDRVAAIGTELSSELSANLTDSETLKTHNPGSNQVCYDDKESGELSAVKITTQKSSCNLKFSEKSNEPKDLPLRYEHHKNSAGHKKIYSCKDELDIGIASTQEEYNFRNLAAIRDEDINCEIKLNNINLETPKHCVSSSLENARSESEVISTGIQGQCSVLESNQCSLDNEKHFETHNKHFGGQFHSDKEKNSSTGDIINKEPILSCDNDVLSGDIRLSSSNPEHRSDKNNLQIQSEESGLLQESSIKIDICQTERDVNALLTLHKDELFPKLNLPGKFINCVSGVEYAENRYKNQSNEICHRDINVLKSTDHDCALDDKNALESECATITDSVSQNEHINYSKKNQNLIITNENCPNESKHSQLHENIQQLNIHNCTQSRNNSHENTSTSNTRDNLSQSEETLSDASEAFTDAEDRLSSPNTDNISTLDNKQFSSGSKLNISCGASTSTESFVDAVESLDDDYLTSTNFRNSREFHYEETVSQNSSSTNDSSTGIAGSMDDLSGWEEFSENIEDINDYNGDMDAKSCTVTNIEGSNSKFCLTDDQTHAPVCITKHVFQDKNYQSPSPPSEPAEIYISKIKTSTLRYKDMRNDAEQKVIGRSIFETGNGGTIKDIDITGVRTQANNVKNVTYEGIYNIGDGRSCAQILSTENEIQSKITDTNSPSKQDTVGNSVHPQENAVSQIESIVGSKIETAVIKRTERRRRRQIEQLKCIACDSKSKNGKETTALNIRKGEQARDNKSIEKISCSHSEHSKYCCTISDNTTFNDEPTSGTGELSLQVYTGLNLNELNLDHSLNLETPLNSNSGDCVTSEVSIDNDKTDKIDITETTDPSLADKKNEIETQLDETVIYETKCDRKFGVKNTVKLDKEEVNSNNEVQLTIEFPEHVQRNDLDMDDIEFIDADDSNQEDQISPNVSFTFSFNENSKDINNCKYDDTNGLVATIYSEEEHMPCENTDNSTEPKPNANTLDKRDGEGSHIDEIIKSESTVLEEIEVICENNSFKNSANTGNSQKVMKCVNIEDICTSIELQESTTTEINLDSQSNNASIDIEADVCEESNISVRLALELEKQNLADDDDVRSRKGLFMSKHAGRRATIETCSFENTEDSEINHELRNDKDIKGKPEIRKSKSFRMERKQISPMASFMNPPEVLESCDSKDCNENVDPINKKVSDICKSFMTKTRSSAQKARAKTLSRSPAPQRKLMKWVNNNGKWMRMPVDDTSNNRDEISNISPQSDLSTTSDSNEMYSPITPEISISMMDSTKPVVNDNLNEERTTLSGETLHSSSTTRDTIDISKSNIQSNEHYLIGDPIRGTCQTRNDNKTTDQQKHNDTQPTNFQETINSNSSEHTKQTSIISPFESNRNDKNNEETDLKQISDVLYNMKEQESNQSESHQNISNTDVISKITEHFDSSQTTSHVENSTTDPDDEPDMKVIGTTLDDAHSDKEKHRQRQELLFGLLDSFNRRKPRRLTPKESHRNLQNSKTSQFSNSVEINIDKQCSSDSDTQNQEIAFESNLKSIPKIKAVKIQEEVFECKTEYLKDTNISQSSECGAKIPKEKLNENGSSGEDRLKKSTDFKSIKLPIRKSKTFAGLGDIERQRHMSSTQIDTETVQSDTRQSCIVKDVTKCSNTMTAKRAKAGLKLNLGRTKARIKCDFEADRSPSRLGPEQSRGRSSGDRSPNRLCVDQSKVRLRSPDKGPRQLQRYKLLSEIVEVEENKDDVAVTCERRQQQQQYYCERARPEGPKPVRRSNKRRSLSLPTGTLAFGDARIVYKNGHFTIETMDNSEYSCNEPADYHSSSRHLDGNVDDMWEMPDTGGDYSRVKSDSRETTDTHNKPHMRRQNAKTVLQSSDSTEDVFYSENEFVENVSPYKININGDTKVLNMGRTSEEVFNESCSSRLSDMSVDSYYSEGMDLSTDESVTDSQKLSSSSLPDKNDVDVKRVMQRAKRTSSFRAAQEGGALRLSGIDENNVHTSARARSISLDESQKSDLSKSPKILSVQNQNPTFLKKVMGKRKTLNENLNISGFSKQSESAREFFTKKMTLKGLFRKNKSDSSVNSPIKTEHPVSPPLATFQDDDIGSVDTPPGSPYRKRNLRRRHTSADILKTYPDSSETDSNCPTPTQERSNRSRHSISSPSTPSHEANSFLNLTSHSSAPQFRDDDEMSITSASSFASSIHSPPLEQPHKPKTPKPVGASPRRNQSFSSQLSRSNSTSSQRNIRNSVTSLESVNYEPVQDDVTRDPRCECVYRSEERKRRMSNRNVRGSTDSISMCQFCKQMEFYRSDSEFYKQQLTGKEKQSDDGARPRIDSSGRNNYDRLGIISQADVVSSNSNDSGIQRDASVHSSNESIKGTADTRLRLRRNKSLSPHPDRPKSEISVRWADGDSGDYDITETTVKLRNKSARDRPRPKSDLDGSSFLSDRMKAFGSEINLQPYCSLRSLYEMKRNDLDRQKNRRMSTPHPIKSRLQRAPQKLHKQPPLVRSSSMPESLEKIHKRRKMHHLLDYHLDSLTRHMDIDALSDESDLSFDQSSLQERSVSVQSSSSQLTAMDEDEDNLTYAEALWDHITMDPEELGFRAQDVIEVLDMADKDWWFGVIDDREGWFPATFVRIRVNQDQLDDDLDLDATIQDNLTTSPKLRRISMYNKNQARSNVVNEIINAEREYVKHLKDVVEGYIQHARKRTEMFPEERIALIFGNLEKIYSFAQKFVSQLEQCIDVCPHLSEIGQCFLDNERGFEIYSDYCNNHPSACEELDELCKDSKYKHFFEACRLLQELVEIPLEGFLLTPVQKICKYPLQLAELLKYTPPDHPDYMIVKDALAAMRKIATLINERKRKMESIEKIAVWQHSVVDWEGPDLLEGSSELIFSGELNKINTAGWSQERFFFLFDHQIVYCKKELLKRHVFSYKGRIDLDHCDIIDVPDGKDSQYNVTVKHAWKFHETLKDKWYLIYAKSEAVKQSWLKAIRDERQRVMEDQENDFCVPDHWKQTVLNKVRSQSHLKDKQSGGRMSHGQLLMQKDLKDFTYSTLPRNRISQKHAKKKGWFNFGGGKKSKR